MTSRAGHLRRFAALFALILIAPGCAPQEITLQLTPEIELPEKSAVIFFADGLSLPRFDALLAEGRLPNIRRRFVEGGVRVQKAVNCIPAMTYPNTVSLMTGQFPGHHGIMGNEWFDRRNMFWIDYISAATYTTVNQNFKSPTLYERIPDHFTFNVQCHTYRGATQSMNNEIAAGIAWGMGWYLAVDQFVGGCLTEVGYAARRAGRWPSVLTFYFPGLDQVGHLHGPESDVYGEMVLNVDAQVGRVTDALERAGLLDRTYLLLVTDHGHVHTPNLKPFDFKEWLRSERGLKCHEKDIPRIGYEERKAFLDNYDAMIVDGSQRRIMIHLRGREGWDTRPAPEEADAVITGAEGGVRMQDLPAVLFACTPLGPDRVKVCSASGAVIIERRIAGGEKEYRILVDDGPVNADALCLAESPDEWNCIAAGWLSSREWLRRTAGSKYPDFVPQIVEYFDSPCAGDILVFVADGWIFTGHAAGEHGSCLTEDMSIPLFFAGPDLPAGGAIEAGRLVDVMPTVLDLLGAGDRIAQPPAIDGVSLAEELRRSLGRQ